MCITPFVSRWVCVWGGSPCAVCLGPFISTLSTAFPLLFKTKLLLFWLSGGGGCFFAGLVIAMTIAAAIVIASPPPRKHLEVCIYIRCVPVHGLEYRPFVFLFLQDHEGGGQRRGSAQELKSPCAFLEAHLTCIYHFSRFSKRLLKFISKYILWPEFTWSGWLRQEDWFFTVQAWFSGYEKSCSRTFLHSKGIEFLKVWTDQTDAGSCFLPEELQQDLRGTITTDKNALQCAAHPECQ